MAVEERCDQSVDDPAERAAPAHREQGEQGGPANGEREELRFAAGVEGDEPGVGRPMTALRRRLCFVGRRVGGHDRSFSHRPWPGVDDFFVDEPVAARLAYP